MHVSWVSQASKKKKKKEKESMFMSLFSAAEFMYELKFAIAIYYRAACFPSQASYAVLTRYRISLCYANAWSFQRYNSCHPLLAYHIKTEKNWLANHVPFPARVN